MAAKRTRPFDDDFWDDDECDILDDFDGDMGNDEEYMEMDVDEDEPADSAKWTITSAINKVVLLAHGSGLSKKFWEKCKNPIEYLTNTLGLTKMQVVVIAILTEKGEAMNWHDFGCFLHCTRLTVMQYSDEIEELIEKGWVYHRIKRDLGNSTKGFALCNGVITALSHNKVFVPEKITGLTTQELIDGLEKYLDRNMNNHDICFVDVQHWMVHLCKKNPDLPLCREVLKLEGDLHAQSLLMMIVQDYAQWAGSAEEGLDIEAVDRFFPAEYETDNIRHKLQNGNHILFEMGFIENKCENGKADKDSYVLTTMFKDDILGDYTPSKSKCIRNHAGSNRGLKECSGITEKKMFYNPSEQKQVERLANMLSKDNFSGIQERLEKEGMRKGFACLFYGGPGTGKTETVLQIARQTGRDIMQVDIATIRDKFVGVTEKRIKSVFSRYRRLCRESETTPILFFNEADGIFGKRSGCEMNPAVEKEENAMQNIILQEMEDLDGILIATTNLTNNLDNAFERRFLFKIEFHKPDVEAKTKLWNSMLHGEVAAEEVRKLAARYDFSGGQIENIARQSTIEYILSGKKASFDEIDEFCKQEMLNTKKVCKPIGFRVA